MVRNYHSLAPVLIVERGLCHQYRSRSYLAKNVAFRGRKDKKTVVKLSSSIHIDFRDKIFVTSDNIYFLPKYGKKRNREKAFIGRKDKKNVVKLISFIYIDGHNFCHDIFLLQFIKLVNCA